MEILQGNKSEDKKSAHLKWLANFAKTSVLRQTFKPFS